MSNTILADVQNLLQEHFTLTSEQVAPEQKLADLGVDSLSTIEFMFQLEDKFGVSLSEYRRELTTVSDVAALVSSALEAKGAIA